MKWYTAIGVKNNRPDGRFYVRSEAEEKILTGMEIQIWSTLLWSFCEEKEIYGRMQALLCIAFGEAEAQKRADEEEFSYCLRRLQIRGLITFCEGDTVEDAVEGMMRRVTMVRARYTKAEQWRFFMNSLKMGKGLRFSIRAFKTADLTVQEEKLLQRLEADGRIAVHLKELEDKAKRTAAFPDVGDTAFSKSIQRDFLADVIALYGRKQLMIESIGKEEYFDESEGCA